MTRSYDIKNKLIPKFLPIGVPLIGVPVSLASAWTIHSLQGLRLYRSYLRSRKRTPTDVPPDAGGIERSMDELMARLPLDQYRPLNLDGYTSTGLRSIPDLAPMYFDAGRRLRGRLHRYPRHFHEVLIPGDGGVPLSGIMGLHHRKLRRPGLIVVHGLLNSKRQDLVRVVTMRAFYEWGFNVIAVDMRGVGRSAEFDSVPNGAGAIEAGDLLKVAQYLKQFPHFSSIGVLGFSLGAGTALRMAALPGAEKLIQGGVLAVSAPIDFKAAVDRFEHLPEDEEQLITYHFFKFLMNRMLNHAEIMKWVTKKIEKEGGDPRIDGFSSFLRNLVAWGYLGQVSDKKRDPDKLLEILFRFASPSRHLAHVRVPTLLLHAKDDPLTRLSATDQEVLTEAAARNPLLRYHLTDKGGHAAYVVTDPRWFYKVVRQYFTYWGDWRTEKEHPFQPSRDFTAERSSRRGSTTHFRSAGQPHLTLHHGQGYAAGKSKLSEEDQDAGSHHADGPGNRPGDETQPLPGESRS